MPRHFKIHELLDSQQLRDLEAFTREPGRTVTEVEEWLGVHGFAVSRGAVWAWRASFLVDDKMQASSELARQFMSAAGKDAVSVSDAAMNQMGQIIFEQTIAMQTSQGDAPLNTSDVVNMTNAIGNLIKSKRHLETLKEEMEGRQRAAVAEAEKTVKAGGSAEDAIRKMREILGIEEAKAA